MRLAATINDAPCPAGLYLGLWADDPGAIPTGLDCTGLITDLRRRRRLDEAGAWYVACLLEAICRADEGTTVGYRCAGNTVVPILAGPGPARSAESRSQEVVAQVRAGVIEGIAERHFLTSANNLQLRSDAQRRLLRLAFFPDAGEIVVASHLVHTEGHAPDWSSPIVLDDRAARLGRPAQPTADAPPVARRPRLALAWRLRDGHWTRSCASPPWPGVAVDHGTAGLAPEYPTVCARSRHFSPSPDQTKAMIVTIREGLDHAPATATQLPDDLGTPRPSGC